jgi:hypothetical protein
VSLLAAQREFSARHIIYAELRAIGIAEIKLGEIAVQVTFATMLIDALHAALEDAEITFNRVRMNGEWLATWELHPLVYRTYSS